MHFCCLNNYPLDKMLQLATAGSAPRQHAWGVDALADEGHRVELAPFHAPEERNWLDYASGGTRHALGQLDQEWYAMRSEAEAFYSADQSSARGLILASKRPVIMIVHHPVRESRLNTAILRRAASLICLSEAVRDSALDAGSSERTTSVASWGPDLDSPTYQSTGEGSGIVSAGKANRDLKTLIASLAAVGERATVYDTLSTLSDAPPRVTLIHPGGLCADPDSPTAYLLNSVTATIANAAVVAIPVADPGRLTGLTELNDALALGKPIIVTRSRYLPVDVDRVGCGITVAPHDVDGWTAALRAVSEPSVRRDMGVRGRVFAEREWNYKVFCGQLLRQASTV